MTMDLAEWLERNERRWTTSLDGHAVQYGDLLDEVIDATRHEYDLFSVDDIMEKLEPVLLKADGESDKKMVAVVNVRKALSAAGL